MKEYSKELLQECLNALRAKQGISHIISREQLSVKEQISLLAAAREYKKTLPKEPRKPKRQKQKVPEILGNNRRMDKWRAANREGPEYNISYHELSDRGVDWLQNAIVRNADRIYPKDETLIDIWQGVGYKHKGRNTDE